MSISQRRQKHPEQQNNEIISCKHLRNIKIITATIHIQYILAQSAAGAEYTDCIYIED